MGSPPVPWYAAAARTGETLPGVQTTSRLVVFHMGHTEPLDDDSAMRSPKWAVALGEYAQRNRGHRLDVLILVGSGHTEDDAVEACITKCL